MNNTINPGDVVTYKGKQMTVEEVNGDAVNLLFVPIPFLETRFINISIQNVTR